jgi:serine phosphatase RsbU (regulator of sigma subunit)
LQRALASVGEAGDAAALADRIVAAVDQFRGTRPLDDDLTLVTVQLEPARRSLAAPQRN